MPSTIVAREYETIDTSGLPSETVRQLKDFALKNTHDAEGNPRQVLQVANGKLKATNYVGILQTRGGTTVEILPKIDLAVSPESTEEERNAKNRDIFLRMLRTWRDMKKIAQFDSANIRNLQNFNMLEVFVWIFLQNLVQLTQRGLARHYHSVEDNLPVLRGRILFPQHIRENMSNRARFYVEYDEFSANRPSNRLIHTTLHQLMGMARRPQNQQLLQQLRIGFADIPQSENIRDDWDRHRVDRSMLHYEPVMQWVGLFLLQQGLATYSGGSLNRALLFPMEQIYEDYVSHAFRRYQNEYDVGLQRPQKYFGRLNDSDAFMMKPDICLLKGDGKVRYILDAKWKRISSDKLTSGSDGISQSDLYQLYAYGKRYNCNKLALLYPKSNQFTEPCKLHLNKELDLWCIPFDVTAPEESVRETMQRLNEEGAYAA